MSKHWSAERVFIFVFTEMDRLRKELESGAARDWSPADVFSSIMDPKGGVRPIGSNAESKLRELAARTIATRPEIKGRLVPADLVRLFKSELATAIHGPQPEAPIQIVDKCVEKAKSAILKDLTFYVPCLLPTHSKVRRFRIGPVQFHDKNQLLRSGFTFTERNKEFFEEFQEQKKYFNWIAEIKVSRFSENLGSERAHLFTRLAVAGLKLAFDDRFSGWLGTDQQLAPNYKEILLRKTKEGHHYFNVRRQFILNADDRQVEHLFSIGSANWLRCLGGFLSHYIEMGDFGFLGNRVITALSWFDTGCSPITDAEKIIAYSNCLEALYTTDDHKQREQLRSRSAPFLKIIDDTEDWPARVGEYYSVRSLLVHGRLSPVDPDLRKHVEFGYKVSSFSLKAMMAFCIWLLQRCPVETTPRHLSPFNGRNSFSKAFLSDVKEFLDELAAGERPDALM